MKTNTFLLLGGLLGAALTAQATPANPPPCCPAPEPAKPACCVEEKPAAPLTARSLYQLEAAWTNDAGTSVKLASLRGKPVILAMFFAQCEYACPVLVNDIKRLLAAMPDAARERARVVLVTFDTVRDTTEALKIYRDRMTLDAQWTLLRGEPADVQELAMLLGVKFKQDARGQFAHSNLITLLNPEGEIIHQHAGLHGDVSTAARVLAAVK
jgi:protein SCO1